MRVHAYACASLMSMHALDIFGLSGASLLCMACLELTLFATCLFQILSTALQVAHEDQQHLEKALEYVRRFAEIREHATQELGINNAGSLPDNMQSKHV